MTSFTVRGGGRDALANSECTPCSDYLSSARYRICNQYKWPNFCQPDTLTCMCTRSFIPSNRMQHLDPRHTSPVNTETDKTAPISFEFCVTLIIWTIGIAYNYYCITTVLFTVLAKTVYLLFLSFLRCIGVRSDNQRFAVRLLVLFSTLLLAFSLHLSSFSAFIMYIRIAILPSQLWSSLFSVISRPPFWPRVQPIPFGSYTILPNMQALVPISSLRSFNSPLSLLSLHRLFSSINPVVL